MYRVKPHKTRKYKFQEAAITEGRTVAGERAVGRLSSQQLEGKWVREWKSLYLVWLSATPWTIQSVGFSRPEHWSG